MAVFNEPNQWEHPLGNNADTSTLPDNAAATAGIASLQKLFQIINATPLEAGGIAPDREDVNALFKYLGDSIFYAMNGGVPSYNAAYDYIAGRVVLYNGNLYKCIQANGASSTVVAPDSVSPLGSDYWSLVITSEMLNVFATIALDNTTKDSIYNLQNSTNDSEKLVALHNNIFRGDNLLDYFDDIQAIKTAVASGDFSKIFVGDYIPATITYNGTQYTTNYRVAGINSFLKYVDINFTSNHLVLVPDRLFDAPMNQAGVISTYATSYMNTTVMPSLLNALNGTSSTPFYGCILPHKELFCVSYANNATANSSYNSSICLLSEMEYTGATLMFKISYPKAGYNAQLPLFKLRPDYISRFNSRVCWTRDIWEVSSSSGNYCTMTTAGFSGEGGYNGNYGVRPRFLFG